MFYWLFIFSQIFDTIDVNRDGLIDFNEFLVVVVLMDRLNDLGSRLSFVFDMYRISVDELFWLTCFFSLGGISRVMNRSIKKN